MIEFYCRIVTKKNSKLQSFPLLRLRLLSFVHLALDTFYFFELFVDVKT